jgi:hypothetical protein
MILWGKICLINGQSTRRPDLLGADRFQKRTPWRVYYSETPRLPHWADRHPLVESADPPRRVEQQCQALRQGSLPGHEAQGQVRVLVPDLRGGRQDRRRNRYLSEEAESAQHREVPGPRV